MQFFWTALALNLKRAFTRTTLMMAALLAILMAVGGYIHEQMRFQAAVGIYISEPSETADRVQESLETLSTMDVVVFETLDALSAAVAAKRIECGYAFAEDMTERLARGDINGSVCRYQSPTTVSAAFTDEMVFAALMKAAAPSVAARYLAEKKVGDLEALTEQTQEQIQSYYQSDIFMNVEIRTAGTAAPRTQEGRSLQLCAGIYSAFVLISFFYLLIQAVEEKNSGVSIRLMPQNRRRYLAAYVLANALALFAASMVGLWFFRPLGIGRVMALMAGYAGVLAALVFLLCQAIKKPDWLYAAFPILSAAMLLLSGAFFDVGAVSPALGQISRLFPSFYFVQLLLG